MRKEAGWQWYPSIGFPSRYSRCYFQTNRCRPHPVRGLKLPSEPCFCHLQQIIVSWRRVKNCWWFLNKFWEIFYDCKTTIRSCSMQTSRLFTKEDGWFCFLLVWRITDHYNDAKVTTAMLPISVKYLCRNTKHRADFSR
jgi:hypothetical protein